MDQEIGNRDSVHDCGSITTSISIEQLISRCSIILPLLDDTACYKTIPSTILN